MHILSVFSDFDKLWFLIFYKTFGIQPLCFTDFIVSSGGDDRRVLLWVVEKALSDIGKPRMMKGEHNSNIFCVAFDVTNSTLFSGGEILIALC